MTARPRRDDTHSEETPLLQRKVKPETSVPWGQIGLALLVSMADTISSEYTTPFTNQFIGELGVTGGDDRKIGYYSGLMEAITCIIEVFSTWHWSRLSDFIGRRPVVLLGLFSLGVTRLSIGLSRSFGMLLASRSLSSVLDGNMGVTMSILAESANNANVTQVFAMLPSVYLVSVALASFCGGGLAKPQERWPHIFQGKFWAVNPYFLPSLVTSIGVFSVFLICAMLLEETLPSKTDKQPESESLEIQCRELTNDERPLSMSNLLTTSSVMIPIANSALHRLMQTSFGYLIPFFYSLPIRAGGLGLSPAVIGVCWGTFSFVEGLLQAWLGPKIIAWLGPKRTLYYTLPWTYPAILLFPVMNTVVTAQGSASGLVWILLVAQLVCSAFMDMGYIVMIMFVTRAAPNNQSLGSVNGLNQSLTAIARATAALSTSLFSFSKAYGVMGGQFVHVVMAVLATIMIVLSRYLPNLEDGEEETTT